ncbi:MAG: hypothetical protein WA793_14405 [Sphingorhabdus sp.]|uniref:hypothetical protein n=1 Tax=Sphingorhabdus sp. TaxID=1902408 RepID=UPI003C930645
MFRNLLALLFLFALALPALAVPAPVADRVMVMAEDCHGMPMQHDDKAPAGEHAMQHGCIGCVAPYAPTIMEARTVVLVTPPLPGLTATLSSFAPKPHDPPPRNGM